MIQFFRDVLATLIRLVLISAGLVMAALVVVLAIVTAAGVFLWSLITGRRPTVRFGGDFATMTSRMRRTTGRPGPARPPAVEVIDIEAREIPERQSAPVRD